MKITSLNNDLVKEAAKLLKNKYREETGLFLLEGFKCIEEALDSNIEILRVFTSSPDKFKPKRNNFEIIETTDAVMSKISDAKSAPQIVAVARIPQYQIEQVKNKNRIILLEGIKDAGNLGTILRTAVAFNIEAVILYGNTVDLYNPKCVRSAVGNLWKIPVYNLKNLSELEIFTEYERVATLPAGENCIPLQKYTPAQKVLLMFGSEADGLTQELKDFANKNITIEMNSSVESLNLSVSASIIMYKLNA